MESTGPWLTTAQAAKHINCNPRSLARWAKKGKVRAKKFGSDYRFHIDDLDRR